MKSSASESIRKACVSLEPLSCSFRLARPGIPPLDRLWNAFDSDAALFMYRTKCIHSYNVFQFVSSLTEMSIFLLLNLVQLELKSASESIQPV